MAYGAGAVKMAAGTGEDRKRGVAHLDSVPLDEILLDVPTDKNDEVEEASAVCIWMIAPGLHDPFEVLDLLIELNH